MSWKVIDVSRYTSINDYLAVASNVDGVIIRAGSRSYGESGSLSEDPTLNTHYNSFLNKNIKIGFYFVSNAITESEARAEAEFTYNLINGKENDFPIYFFTDFAKDDRSGRADRLTPSARTDMALAFVSRLNELGYRGGILAEDSFYYTNLDLTRITPLYPDNISLWVTKISSTPPIYVTDYDGWRYTGSATIPGSVGYLNETDFVKDVANWEAPVVDPEDINNYDITIEQDEYTYTGSRITPTVTVDTLRLGSDYIVTYENNLHAGIGSAIVTGINNYKGTATKTFTILPRNINEYSLVINPTSYEYTGSPIRPTYSISDLMIGMDFKESIYNNINMGTATLTLTGINDYTGSVSGNFNITAESIEGMVAVLSQYTYEYSGNENKPSITVDSLTKGVDYVERWYSNINAGTGHAVAKGIGNYTGEIDIIFNITPKSIVGSAIYLTSTRIIYTGEALTPRASIYGLTENVDFTTQYRNNINAGTATVIVNGIGNYKDNESTTFTIVAKPITDVEVSPVDNQYYTGQAITPSVVIPGLVLNTDYRISYQDNTNIGTGFIVIGGVGNYYGTRNYPFNIVERPMSETDLYYGDPSVNHNFRIYTGSYFLCCKDTAIRLKEEINYHVSNIEDTIINMDPSEEFPDGYTYTLRKMTIEGIGGLVGEYTFELNVLDEEIFDHDEPTPPEPPAPYDPELDDDFLFNFGDEDDKENPDDPVKAGKDDFGDLESGVDPESDLKDGDYDFNILTAADLVINKLIANFGVNCDDIKDGTYDSLTGLDFDLDNTPIYANYCSLSSSESKSGLYFIYRPEVRSAKVRLTRLESAVEQPVRSTGWVRIHDLAMLSMYSVGEKVIVNGKIYKYPNGTGSYVEYYEQPMYVSKIQKNDNTETFEYPYGLSLVLNGTVVGYANSAILKKADDSTQIA